MITYVGQQFGDYRLIHELGHGGFGVVYLAEHVDHGTVVAVKVLKTQLTTSEDLTEFINEARTFRLKHPNIIELLDFGIRKPDSTPFLVTTYAPNGTVRTLHPQNTCIPYSTVITYVKQVAVALQYIHDMKLVHRDVKPENMLVGKQNEILLSDFGIAVVVKKTGTQTTQGIIGTLWYTAPEQLRGKPVPASDQYSLACVIYEWLCGTTVFNGNHVELISQHLHDPPQPLRNHISTISPAVEAVILKALAKDPQQRFSSILEFAQNLEQANTSGDSLSSSPPPSPPLPIPAAAGPVSTVYTTPLAPTMPAQPSNQRKLLLTCHSHLTDITAGAWSQSGQYLALHNHNAIEIWDTTNGSIVFAYQQPSRYPHHQPSTQTTTPQKSGGIL